MPAGHPDQQDGVAPERVRSVPGELAVTGRPLAHVNRSTPYALLHQYNFPTLTILLL